MAVYNGREVHIVSLTQAPNADQVTIESPELGQLRIPLAELQVTEKDKESLEKRYSLGYPFNVVKEHKNYKTFKDQRELPPHEAFEKQKAAPAARSDAVSSVQPVRPDQKLNSPDRTVPQTAQSPNRNPRVF